jgi:hypothetical protein
VLENQAAVLQHTEAAVIKVIDKFDDVNVRGDEIIKQALRTLKAIFKYCGSKCINDENLWSIIFSASAISDKNSLFLAVMKLMLDNSTRLSLTMLSKRSSSIINGFDKHGCNSEVLMVGCEFLKWLIGSCHQLLILKVMLSLLPHQAMNANIVDASAEAIRNCSTFYAASESSAPHTLKHLLIAYGGNEKIFRAMANFLARGNHFTCLYFLHEIVFLRERRISLFKCRHSGYITTS